MAEPKIEQKVDAAVSPVVKELSSLEAFTINHPRTAKVVGIVALTGVTFAAIAGWKAHKLKTEKTEVMLDGNVVRFDDSSETA